jgi:hypothetical protein
MKNKDGLWALSPSGLYNFIGCPACFWVDQHVGRAPILPLRLNDAMDAKLKSRYDSFRKKGTLPPEIEHLKGMKLFPDLEQLDIWREKKSELQFVNERDGYVLAGKIDELFVTSRGEFAVADYKSSGDEPTEKKLDYYLFQLHAYALMFQKKGHKVSNKAYLLNYYPKTRTSPSMSVDLACKVIEAKLDLQEFEKTMRKMVKFLNSDYPDVNEDCKTCSYNMKRRRYLDAV